MCAKKTKEQMGIYNLFSGAEIDGLIASLSREYANALTTDEREAVAQDIRYYESERLFAGA